MLQTYAQKLARLNERRRRAKNADVQIAFAGKLRKANRRARRLDKRANERAVRNSHDPWPLRFWQNIADRVLRQIFAWHL